MTQRYNALVQGTANYSSQVQKLIKDLQDLQTQQDRLKDRGSELTREKGDLVDQKRNAEFEAKAIQTRINRLEGQTTRGLTANETEELSKINNEIASLDAKIARSKSALNELKAAAADKKINTRTDTGKATKEYKEIQDQVQAIANLAAAKKELESRQSALTNLGKTRTRSSETQSQIDQLKGQLEEKRVEIEILKEEIESKERQIQENKDLQKQKKSQIAQASSKAEKAKRGEEKQAKTDMEQAQKDALLAAEEVEKVESRIESLKEKLQSLDQINLQNFKDALKNIIPEEELAKINSIDELKVKLQQLSDSGSKEATAALQELEKAMERLSPKVSELNQNSDKLTKTLEQENQMAKDVEGLKSRIVYFFGLVNVVNMARRAIQNAISTVKELDKTMTQTAVVTDFSVSDMWKQLPEYTRRANELGIATNEAYAAATLYYQQGLDTNEVTAVSTETLKMARIAGIEAAQATDYMTAALRGFNMEVNEMSAQRVSDVYSKLAAITASNTEEISVAMTKVASLAHNANMEFETTAAFLSQIIETTRESAETAGTALKTVVARFSEVKKLYSEGDLMGTDEEGQEIDVNKVSTALRTAGINLNEYLAGTKGLDDIFMELASKWDSLDAVQQRYIATMAAGSRQQSRFIAMMSNYSRTVELVDAANTSAGASNEQFEKTLKSLESKIAQLENAWNEFTLSLSNNNMIKLGVDLLTTLLNTINAVTGAFGQTGGALAKIVVVFAAFKSGQSFFSAFLNNIAIYSKGGLDALNNGLVDSQGNIEKTSQSIKLMGLAMQDSAQKTSLMAGGLGLLAGILSNVIEKTANGNKTALAFAQGLKYVSTAAIIFSVAMKVLPPLLASFGYQLTLSTGALGGLLAVVGLVAGAIGFFGEMIETSSEKLERLKEENKDIESELETINSLMDSIGDKREALNNMTEGTEEWKNALVDLNDEILKAIENNEKLAPYLRIGENGELFLDAEGIKEYQKEQRQTRFENQSQIYGAKIQTKREERERQSALYNYSEEDARKIVENIYDALKNEELSINFSAGDLNQLAKDKGWIGPGGQFESFSLDYNLLSEINWIREKNLFDNFDKYFSGLAQSEIALTLSNIDFDENTDIGNKLFSSILTPDYYKKLLKENNNDYVKTNEALQTMVESFNLSNLSPLAQKLINGKATGTEIEGGDSLLQEALEEAFGDGELYNNFIETLKNQRIDGENIFKDKFGQNEEFSKQYTTSTLNALSEQIEPMSKKDAQNYIESFNGVIKNSDLGSTAKENLESYLSTIDWSNLTQAISAMDYMQSLGLETSEIKNFWDIATTGAKAFCSNTEEAIKLTGIFQQKNKNTKEISERLTEGKATYEDLQTLSAAGVDITNFSLTEEGWKGTAEAIQEATEKLREWNAEQARAAAEKNKQGLEEAEAFFNENNKFKEGDRIKSWSELDDTDKEGLPEKLGVYSEEGETPEEYWARAEEAYNRYKNAIENKSQIEHAFEQTQYLMEAQSYDSGQEALDANGTTQAMSIMLQQVEEGTEIAEIFAQNIGKEIANDIKISEQQMKAMAYDVAKLRSQILALNDVFNKNKEILKSGQRETAEYKVALSQFKKAFKDTFKGIDDKYIDEFFNNNQELIENWDTNAEACLESFKTTAQQAFEDTKIDIKGFDSMLDQVDPEIGIVSTFNSAGFIAAMTGLDQMEVSAEEAMKILQQLDAYANLSGIEMTYSMQDIEVLKDPKSGKVQMAEVLSSVQFSRTGANNLAGVGKVGSGGGGGGGGGAAKEWENPYDWLYNLTQKINEELRTREKLERKYDMLLKNRQKSAKDIINNRKAELETLKQEQKLQEEMLSKRTEEGQRYMQENSDLLKYGKLVTDENGRVTVEIDWDLINTVKDEEEGKRVEDFISNLERIEGEIENAEDGLDDIEDRILEIYEQGKDEYFDLEDKIYDAVVNARQEEIDELSAINDTLTDTNQKIIDAMSKEIEKMRQDRENERTEQDIADKQQRLAYLQQDTSGANAMEIMKLQEEISNSQESYTDSLIDQKINELEEQNDKAAEQRQQQIDVLQTQLEHDQKVGEIWKQVYALWQTGIDSDGKLINNSNLEEILKNSENFDGLSEQSKMNWMGELETQMKAAVSYLAVGRSAKSLLTSGEISENDSITFTDIRNKDSQKTIKGKVDKDGNVIDSAGNVYSGVHQDETGKWVFDQNGTYKAYQAPTPKVEQKQEQQQQNTTNVQDTQPHGWKFTVNGVLYNFTTSEADARANWNKFNEQNKKIEEQIRDTKNAPMPANEKQKQLDYLYTQRITLSNITAYKTGGVADFTGPAWLDGTPSKPEIILNQKDSQNFIQLKNILATLMSGSKTTASENNGDNYYDVDINVEKLESDYDVEQVAEKVKSMIRRDATYRNVNVINNTR